MKPHPDLTDELIRRLSYVERRRMLTHYRPYRIEYSYHVRGGCVDSTGTFVNLYIDLHKGEITKLNLKEYDPGKKSRTTNR